MKVTCLSNQEHLAFVTTAHEMHDWKVDSKGDFLEDLGCVQVDQGPEIGNLFTCAVCGSEAAVEEAR